MTKEEAEQLRNLIVEYSEQCEEVGAVSLLTPLHELQLYIKQRGVALAAVDEMLDRLTRKDRQ